MELRPGTKPPQWPQYPLKEEATQGIETQIMGVLKAGVLMVNKGPQSNMPRLPLKKLDDFYRLVYDFHSTNVAVTDVPNPLCWPQFH